MQITQSDKIYISGPMTGFKNFNKDNFFRVERELENCFGCKTFNPAWLPDGFPYAYYMRVDFLQLTLEASGILMLKGWEQSRGAKIEFSMARALELKVFSEAQFEIYQQQKARGETVRVVSGRPGNPAKV